MIVFSNVVTEQVTKKAIFTMGLSGSGKSTVLNKRLDIKGFTVIDPDTIKQEQALYNPKQPEVFHEWSKEQAKERQALAMANNENIIIDGTGTNTDKMYKNIREMQSNGYFVELLYVRTTLDTALERNANRERVVPEEIIREKHDLINYSLEILSNIVDKLVIVDND